MKQNEFPITRRRLNLIIAANIFCWAITIVFDADAIVADMAILAFLTTLALYPWPSKTRAH